LHRTASEAAQLAVRAQHIQRWKVPRKHLSDDQGRLSRNGVPGFNSSRANTAGELMRQAGYDDADDRTR